MKQQVVDTSDLIAVVFFFSFSFFVSSTFLFSYRQTSSCSYSIKTIEKKKKFSTFTSFSKDSKMKMLIKIDNNVYLEKIKENLEMETMKLIFFNNI